MARRASSKSDSGSSSTATIGFEAKLWPAADSRSAAETAEGNRSNNMDAAEPSGARKTAKGSPQSERGGVHQFYPPSCVVRCLVEMLAPYNGRIYDLACGSGGMFVRLEKFVESHGTKLGDISIYGEDKQARHQRSFGIANALPVASSSCGSVKVQSNKGPNMLQLARKSVDYSSSV